MSDSIPTTSAGRLLIVLKAIKKQYEQNDTPSLKAIIELADGAPHWSRWLISFERLVDETQSDLSRLDALDPDRRKKYQSALHSARQVASEERLHTNTSQLLKGSLTEVVWERIEGLRDYLAAAGVVATVEQVRADAVASELRELIGELENSPETEIDEFLRERLTELEHVLNKYSLYGPAGVQHAVENLIGGIAVKCWPGAKVMPDEARGRINRAIGIAHGAVETFVYAHAGYTAISWAGGGAAALLRLVGNAG